MPNLGFCAKSHFSSSNHATLRCESYYGRALVALKARIAYFGKEGSNTQQAAMRMFGGSCDFEGCTSIQKVFSAVEEGKASHGVVPIENSVEGTVGLTNDLLYRSNLCITGESYLKIMHCLIARPGTALEGMRHVISHPQALGQCSEFLSSHGLEGIPFADTASSVSALSREEYSGYGAIAAREAASIYGMEVLLEDVGDFRDNYTRFVSISREPNDAISTAKTKASVVVSVDHKPGSLKEVLEIYHRYGINLTKIESRPVKHSPWRYIFFLDSQGTPDDEAAFRELQQKCLEYKFLGRYPTAFPD